MSPLYHSHHRLLFPKSRISPLRGSHHYLLSRKSWFPSHARRVIQRLAQRHEGKAFIEHLIALNHYTRNFAITINKDPPLKNYEDIARAHRWNIHNYSISQPKFNARGRAQAKVQLIVDYTIEYLRHKEAVFEFLGQLFKFTNLELKRIRNEATPRYEENLRKLFH